MASTTRSTRRTVTSESDMSTLSNLDRLILAQAVHEYGANAWPTVAKVLSKHPLLSRPKSFFTAQSCHVMHSHLMKEAGLECTEANNAVRAPANLGLAQRHYQARFLELRDLIAADEVKFKTLAAEIDDIRSGLWDDNIVEKITGVEASPLTPAPELPMVREKTLEIVVPETAADEIFESDLGGVTDSGNPPTDLTVMRKASTPCPDMATKVATEEPVTVDLQEPPIQDNSLEDGLESPIHGVPSPIAIEEPPSTVDHLEDQNLQNPIEAPVMPLVSNDPPQHTDHMETVSEFEAPDRSTTMPEGQETVEVLEDEAGSFGDEPLNTTHHASIPRHSSVSSATPSHTKPRRGSRDATLSPQQRPTQAAEPLPAQDDREVSVIEIDDPLKANTPLIEDDRATTSVVPEVASVPRRESKRKASFVETTESRDRKRAREDSEPADEDEPGPSGPARRRRERQAPTGEQVALKRFQNVIGMLHSQISQHRNGNIFHNPIKNSEAPDYHEIVKRPMDLKTIKARVKDGAITNSLDYQRDVYLMFANALMYNRPGTDIYHMAETMMLESEGFIHTFRQTEALGFVRGTHRV